MCGPFLCLLSTEIKSTYKNSCSIQRTKQTPISLVTQPVLLHFCSLILPPQVINIVIFITSTFCLYLQIICQFCLTLCKQNHMYSSVICFILLLSCSRGSLRWLRFSVVYSFPVLYRFIIGTYCQLLPILLVIILITSFWLFSGHAITQQGFCEYSCT